MSPAVLSLLRSGWTWLVIALVAAAAALAYQHVRVVGLRLQLADAATAVEREKAERLADLNAHNAKVAALERAHAAQQQDADNAHAAEIQNLAHERDARVADARSLRDQLAAATARSRSGGATSPAACERDRDQLEALGRLVGEGVELVAEAQSLFAQRAAEVNRLHEQTRIDRAACTTP